MQSLLRSGRELVRHARLHPFDTSTAAGRTQERHRRVLLTMGANVLARGTSLLVIILTLRIALPYLGQERYGALATVVSFSALLTFLDLGIGNALVGRVAQASVTAGESGLAGLVSRATWVLASIGLAIATVLGLLATFAPLAWAFKDVSAGVLLEVRHTLLLFAVLFGLSIPLGAAQKVYHGLQRGYVVHLVTTGFMLAGLGLLALLTTLDAPMPAFLFAGYGMQVLSGGALLIMLARGGGLTGPRLEYFVGPATRDLLRVGGLFFFLQLGVMAGWGGDALILSATIGPAAVVVFTIVDRASQLVTVPLTMVNAPLWASYAEAFARGDTGYIRKTLRRSLVFTVAGALGMSAALYAASGPLFRFMAKATVAVPVAFLVAFLAWIVLRAVGDSLAMYLNGVHVLRPQLAVVVLYVALSVPVKVVVASGYGLAPFVVASLSCYILAVVVPYLTVFRRQVLLPLEQATERVT